MEVVVKEVEVEVEEGGAGGVNAYTDQQLEAAAIQFSDPLGGKMQRITK